jgi:hypothetical protein
MPAGTRGRTLESMEVWLLIAAMILLAPVVALWIDDERDRRHPKSR